MSNQKKYSHAVTVGFEIETDNYSPTTDELITAMEKRLSTLKGMKNHVR
jgi:hypothetical protein